jgi:hypothetical protein
MKVQKVIHACNDNPFYKDFWPIVSKIWKLKFAIEPVLLYFGEDNPSSEYGQVVKMKAIDGVPISTQAQCSRYWFPHTEQETIWMTSDIDMLPISKKYFIDDIMHYEDHKFISLNGNPEEKYPHRNFSCCYNVGKGSTFTEILQLPDSFEKFMGNGFWLNNSHNYKPQGLDSELPHWGADEQWSSSMLNKFYDQSRIDILFRQRCSHQFERIDRSNWRWSEERFLKDEYCDSHSVRPYSKNKQSIDKLVELILRNV